MKIEKTEIINALKKSAKGNFPIYKNMCALSYDGSSLSVQMVGSDYAKEITINNFVIESEENFRVAFDAVLLAKLIKSVKSKNSKIAKNEYIEFAIVKEALSLITASGNYDVLSIDDYPEFEDKSFKNFKKCNQELFANALKKIIASASKDSIKPVFNGVFFEKNVMVASDSRRLSVVELSDELDKSGVVPLDSISEIKSSLTKTGNIEYTISDDRACFIIGDTKIVSRLIDGNFPDYKKVVPSEFRIEGVFNRKVLIENLERVKLFTELPTYKITLDVKKSKIDFKASTPEIGKCKESVSFKTSKFEEVSMMGLNVSYVLDAIKSIDSEKVLFNFTGNKSPVLISSEKKESYTVVMPIQIMER